MISIQPSRIMPKRRSYRSKRKALNIVLYALIIAGLIYLYFSISRQKMDHFFQKDSDHSLDGVDPFIDYRLLPKKDWFNLTAFEIDKLRSGPGERGESVVLPKDNITLNKIRDDLYRVNGYDAYVSDLISLDRSIKDIRHAACKNEKYIEKLPSISVILPFHDEHFSTLLRSGYSIINKSPSIVLKEIIFVDDASSKPELKEPFELHWKNHKFGHLVKVVRTSKREGLIRARGIGARAAIGEILIFLDSHSEANYNWIPPLIEPIALNYRTVVCPFVDIIDCDTYEYRAQDEGARGSFDWEFNYKRLPLTEDDLKNPTRPFKSPIMAGGYFAISTKWFWELGGYDEGLDIWGGEQYELSFKIWQCHGKLVDAPCSRVGHIYRCKYIPFGNPGIGDFISRNYRRVAEVWMDEYKEHLYKRKPALRTADAGNLDKQHAVRTRLKCKSFDWFMKEIAFDQDHFYPAVEPQDGANGELRNIAIDNCLDMQFKGTGQKVELKPCKSKTANSFGEQNLRLTFWEDVRSKERTMCFDAPDSSPRSPITIFSCHGMKGNQHFKYFPNTKHLIHKPSGKCVDADSTNAVFINICDHSSPSQRWDWQNVFQAVLDEWEKNGPKAQGGLQ